MTIHQPLILNSIHVIDRIYVLRKPLEFVVTTIGKSNGVIEYCAEDKNGLGMIVYSATYGDLPYKICQCFDLCYRTVMGERLAMRDQYKRLVASYTNVKVEG